MTCRVHHERLQQNLATRAEVATTMVKRVVGLLSKRFLREGEALIFLQCASIHTCFMRFPIDVIFLKTDEHAECGMRNIALVTPHAAPRTPHAAWSGVVVKVVQSMGAFRLAGAFGADMTIELPAGLLEQVPTQPGDRLSIIPAHE